MDINDKHKIWFLSFTIYLVNKKSYKSLANISQHMYLQQQS